MDDEAADAGLAGIVVLLGGGLILTDFVVGTLDASLDCRVCDVRA